MINPREPHNREPHNKQPEPLPVAGREQNREIIQEPDGETSFLDPDGDTRDQDSDDN